MDTTKKNKTKKVSKSEAQIEKLNNQLREAQEAQQRALADYQNLVRRNRDERLSLVKMASRDLATALLDPLNNLSLAAEQVNDAGLDMVVKQLWQTLENQGLEEIKCLGKPFNINTMEAVDKKGDGEKVVKVVRRGYKLNGDVLQFAKVVVN